ncbi:MAG: ATP-binding protein [Kiritimatiellia bacterium]
MKKQLKVFLIGCGAEEARQIERMLMEASQGSPYPGVTLDCGAWEDIGNLQRSVGVDVLLADISAEGEEAGTRVREFIAQAGAKPVILLSGEGQESTAEQAVRQGAQDWVDKQSMNGRVLLRSILNAIARSAALQTLKDNEQRLRYLLASLPTYIYRVTLRRGKTVFTEHTPGCQAVTGYTPLDYAADPDLWIKMVHPEDREPVRRYVEQIMAGETPSPIEHRIHRKDGSLAWVRNTVIRHFDTQGNLVGYDGLVEDITARKEAEQALRRAHDELEARVRARTEELARANRELAEAVQRLKEHDRARSEFVANVSHELKSPLATMTYAIENLLNNVVGPLDERVRAYLLLLKEECQRLDRTTDDILEMSRIENKTLTLNQERVAVGPLIQRPVELLRLQAERKQQKITVAPIASTLFAYCDPERMYRVLRNLLHNAIKFTPPGGEIELRAAARVLGADARIGSGGSKAESNQEAVVMQAVEIAITDSGIGIPAHLIPRVTERYFRVDDGGSGTGLGLAICKEIVELHGGRLTIQSPPPRRNTGTEVVILLPAAPPGEILALVRDEEIARFLADQLSGNWYRLKVCKEFGGLTKESRPDVVLVEFDATAGDTELIARLRGTAGVAEIPVVGVGWMEVDGPFRLVLQGLGIPFIKLPVDRNELLDRLAGLHIRGRPGVRCV